MDNLVFDGRGDSLLGCHSSRGGGGNWVCSTRPERLRRSLTAGVDKKKTNKQTNNPNKKPGKKIKNIWWKSNNAIKVFSL